MFSNPGSRSSPGSDGQLKILNALSIGGNVVINTTMFSVGNSTANFVCNSSNFILQNTTTSVIFTPQSVSIGNSTANVFSNSIQAQVANSTSNVVITPLTVSVGNSVANVFMNSVFWQVVNSTANTKSNPGTVTLAGAGSNTGLTLGTSTIVANGFTWLPNGVLLQWFHCNATSTATSFTFPTAFPTGPFVIQGNSNGSSANFSVAIVNSNTTATALKTANVTAMNVTVFALGN